MTEAENPRPTQTLCVGEALVDLICEHPAQELRDASAFVPHCGGAVANVAVFAARAGANVALAGALGADEWGDWLHDQLEDEGVELSLVPRLAGSQTSIAIVTVDPEGDPRTIRYGSSIGLGVSSLGDALDRAVLNSAALFFSSGSLIGDDERAAVMRARDLALAHERPVIFDPNLSLERWSSRTEAQATANECVPGAFLVRASQADAALLTGEPDPERAATALLKAGARMAVVSLGADGAILRGELRSRVAAVQAHVVSTVGAGDAFMGTLLASLALSDYYPAALAAALPRAVAAAAAACERWGTID